jgi:hypothetical protein
MANTEKAKYVADLARELAAMARRLDLVHSAHILDVAVVSLEEEEREQAECARLPLASRRRTRPVARRAGAASSH